jgi:hypothetical protein
LVARPLGQFRWAAGEGLSFAEGAASRRSARFSAPTSWRACFDELGGGPSNVYTSVHLKDDLTVSLLQARLIELNLPIKVKAGTSG